MGRLSKVVRFQIFFVFNLINDVLLVAVNHIYVLYSLDTLNNWYAISRRDDLLCSFDELKF